jgi:hypothetical protein
MAAQQASEPLNGLEPPQATHGGFGRAAGCRQPGSEDGGEAWASDKAELEDDRGWAGSMPPGAGQPPRAELAGAGSWRPLEKPNCLLWRLWGRVRETP